MIGLIAVSLLAASACKKTPLPSIEIVEPAEQSAEVAAPAEQSIQAKDNTEFKVNVREEYEKGVAFCKLLQVAPSGAAFKFCVLLNEESNTFKVSISRLDDPSKNYDALRDAVNQAITASGALMTDRDIDVKKLRAQLGQCDEDFIRRGFSQNDSVKYGDMPAPSSTCLLSKDDLFELNLLLTFEDLDSDGKLDFQVFAGCGDLCRYNYWRWNEAEQSFEEFEPPHLSEVYDELYRKIFENSGD